MPPILSFVAHGEEPLWAPFALLNPLDYCVLHFKCRSTKYATSASLKASGARTIAH